MDAAPRSLPPARPARPRALAPAWARVVIGGVLAGATGGPLLTLIHGQRDASFLIVPVFGALVGLIAALAADLDRPRPRLLLALAIAALTAAGAWLLIWTLDRLETLPPLLVGLGVPVLAGAIRARAGREGTPILRGLACLAFTLMLFVVPPVLFVAAELSRLQSPPFAEHLFAGLTGAAFTGGLVASGFDRRAPWPVAPEAPPQPPRAG